MEVAKICSKYLSLKWTWSKFPPGAHHPASRSNVPSRISHWSSVSSLKSHQAVHFWEDTHYVMFCVHGSKGNAWHTYVYWTIEVITEVEIWSWFPDRKDGPPELNQGHGGILERIQAALRLGGPMGPSPFSQVFQHDPAPESWGPMSRSSHCYLSRLTFWLWFHICAETTLDDSELQLASLPSISSIPWWPSSSTRCVVFHQDCSAWTSPALTFSQKLFQSFGRDSIPSHPL